MVDLETKTINMRRMQNTSETFIAFLDEIEIIHPYSSSNLGSDLDSDWISKLKYTPMQMIF